MPLMPGTLSTASSFLCMQRWLYVPQVQIDQKAKCSVPALFTDAEDVYPVPRWLPDGLGSARYYHTTIIGEREMGVVWG
jgi:hypothetical protein